MKYNKIVIKVGSSSLTYKNGALNLRFLDKFARILADINNSGTQVVLVTSGAVSAGRGKLGLTGTLDIPHKQAAAAVGQCELMSIYDRFFCEYGQTVGQVLLTRTVIENEVSYNNAKNTFESLLSLGVIPIVNENDTVSTSELEALRSLGDNDRLSAIVATMIGAQALVIMSDVDGLYDSNPKTNPDAKLISEVNEITDEIRALCDGKSEQGTGGMASKLEAAEAAYKAGFDFYIINSSKPDNLYDVLDGKSAGTCFRGRKK